MVCLVSSAGGEEPLSGLERVAACAHHGWPGCHGCAPFAVCSLASAVPWMWLGVAAELSVLRQIGLVDMMKEEYGIVPAGMLGHSAGGPSLTYTTTMAYQCCTSKRLKGVVGTFVALRWDT